MDSKLDSSKPDHFTGPDGAIYTVVCKSPKQIFDPNNNGSSAKDKQGIGFSDGIYSEIEPQNDAKSMWSANKNNNNNNNIKHHQDSHSDSNGLKFNAMDSTNIYEVVPELPAASSPTSTKRMNSEEEAKLQNLLSDLLGMADNFCEKMNEKKGDLSKSKDTKDIQMKVNHPEFKNFKTASSDSGFYQQLSHDDDNNSSCIHPAKYPAIRPSNHPSIYPLNDIYAELKLPVTNVVPHQEDKSKESQINVDQEQEPDKEGNVDAKKKETSDKATETENDLFSVTDPRPIENFYSFLDNKTAKLTGNATIPTIIATTTNNFRDQHQKDYPVYNENFANPSPDFHLTINGSKVMTYSGSPLLTGKTDGRFLTDCCSNTNCENLQLPSETLNLTFHPKSASNSPNNVPKTFQAPTCSNCNMNFEDHSRKLCCQIIDHEEDDDDDDDLASLCTGTIPGNMSESINSLMDMDTPYAEKLAIQLVCSSRDGRVGEKRRIMRRKNQEEEVVTLEPIGIGMQVLENERQIFPSTVDNRNLALLRHHPIPLLPPPPPLTPGFNDNSPKSPRFNDLHDPNALRFNELVTSRSPGCNNNSPKSPRFNDFYDSKYDKLVVSKSPGCNDTFHTMFSCSKTISSHPSASVHHMPLVKSISSGYHEKRSGSTEEWDDPAYYSPQPSRTDFALDLRKTNPTGGHQQYQVQTNNTLRHQNFASCNNFQTNHRFRQNNNNNFNINSTSKLPTRLRQKLNNNHNNISNNNNNSYINREGFTFQYQKSPSSNFDLPFFPQKEVTSLRNIQFPTHQPLKGFHSLQIPAKDQNQDQETGFEELCSTMPRSMKLLNPKYHQISEPQLFRTFPIDSNLNPLEVMTTPRFITDQSKQWYHPNMSREQAVKLLLNKPAGSFIIRNSNSFEGAYGLVVKVDKIPQQVISASPYEYVRHFLIETTAVGVRIKGSPLEPTFGSLSTLVYQHMLTPLSLPCPLVLNQIEENSEVKNDNNNVEIISQVLEETFYYVNGLNTEGLTGQVAMTKAIDMTFNSVCTTQFKVTKVKLRLDNDGLSFTDLERKLFFRKKYPWNCISYSGIDNSPKVFFAKGDGNTNIFLGRLFCIVAKSNPLVPENTCHLLASTKSHDHNFIGTVEAINDRIKNTRTN